MPHYRQTIRDAVSARLLAANTGAGQNVFTSRARPVLELLQRRESVLSVYTADERSVRDPDGHLMRRTLVVSIEGMASGGDDLDGAMDTLAAEVEAAIDADPSLAGLLHDDLVLTSTTSEISARGNMQVGAFRLDYEGVYLSSRGVDAGLPPAPPLPTELTVRSEPVPDGYVRPLDDARRDPPDLVPSEILPGAVAPSRPVAPVDSACADGSCDIPVWAGDQP